MIEKQTESVKNLLYSHIDIVDKQELHDRHMCKMPKKKKKSTQNQTTSDSAIFKFLLCFLIYRNSVTNFPNMGSIRVFFIFFDFRRLQTWFFKICTDQTKTKAKPKTNVNTYPVCVKVQASVMASAHAELLASEAWRNICDTFCWRCHRWLKLPRRSRASHSHSERTPTLTATRQITVAHISMLLCSGLARGLWPGMACFPCYVYTKIIKLFFMSVNWSYLLN